MISIVILLIYQEQLINLPFFHKGMSAILCIFFFFFFFFFKKVHFMYLVLTNITLKLHVNTNG